MPQNAFFFFFFFFFFYELTIFWSAKNRRKDTFFPPSSRFPRYFFVCFANATVVAFVLLRNSRFNFHCYTQLEAWPIQKLARKWRCDLSRLLARKITKGIHSCKPASLNRPIGPSAILFAGVYVCTFQPGNFTSWISEGVKYISRAIYYLSIYYSSS